MKRRVKIILSIPLVFFLIIVILLAMIFLIRIVTPTEIDDVSPGIPCPEIQQYNPDILYVIPDYHNNNPISENKEWCNYILSLDKTLALHGISHEYKEFLYEMISQEELDFAISEFEKCFGFSPELFKPPQIKINKKNKELIEQNNLKLKNVFNQITHKVYHCNNSDLIPNKIIHIF